MWKGRWARDLGVSLLETSLFSEESKGRDSPSPLTQAQPPVPQPALSAAQLTPRRGPALLAALPNSS